jgi:hypothetical protein
MPSVISLPSKRPSTNDTDKDPALDARSLSDTTLQRSFHRLSKDRVGAKLGFSVGREVFLTFANDGNWEGLAIGCLEG